MAENLHIILPDSTSNLNQALVLVQFLGCTNRAGYAWVSRFTCPPPIEVFTPIFQDKNVALITKLAGTTSKIVAFLKISTIFRISGPKGSKKFSKS